MKRLVQYSQKKSLCLSVIMLLLGMTTMSNSIAATGDKLIITGDIVNLRAEPSTEADSPIKLLKDREVTEIQRQNDWVEIETHRKDIKTGWVHKSLLEKARVMASPNTSSPTRFERFMVDFNDHNQVLKKKSGVIYFSEAKNKGQGEIELFATEAWMNAEIELRNNLLSEIFKLWGDVTPVGSSISIRVFDTQGEPSTLMMR